VRRTTAALILTLLILSTAGTPFVSLAEANPLPPLVTEIMIKEPQNISYNIDETTPQPPEPTAKPELFPTVPVAAVSVAAVVLLIAGLLVYHKKHKR